MHLATPMMIASVHATYTHIATKSQFQYLFKNQTFPLLNNNCKTQEELIWVHVRTWERAGVLFYNNFFCQTKKDLQRRKTCLKLLNWISKTNNINFSFVFCKISKINFRKWKPKNVINFIVWVKTRKRENTLKSIVTTAPETWVETID